MPNALALSPHLDDAAFSCGGLLASLARDGWHVAMATVFTGSVADPRGFALACQLDKGLPAEIDYMALRRAEDVRAAAELGIAPPLHLPFREAPHRGYGSAPELFSEVRTDDGIAAELAPALARLIAAESPDVILAPQAVGGHVDHVQAVRALRSLDGLPPILWWRDFPYTVREAAPREPLADLFAALPVQRMVLGGEARARKRAACAAYASQIGFQFGGVAGLDARLAREEGVERFRVSGPLDAAISGLDAG
ncbi:PIG-L deacetylase family protein [Methylobacterium sp. NEAU K]|uniref:PIG-L deacetylase family protein n=1 Tax=Methylobacterium sp. NEAU K TaxID=3064946 RepID=UPI0027323746|nr:PIG-L family deacetylase [Methylobacterium sp. NEAU K]MDP4002004.1 PIG-L family deacetylase [Methylobacterium sp. NEAU K]